VQAYREYAVWRPGSAILVARARARWAYIDRTRGVPLRVPDEMVERFSPLGPPMRCRQPVAQQHDLSADVHTMHLIARETEADVNQHVNNTVYADWLAEALSRTLHDQMIHQTDRELLPREYHIEYLRPTLPGDGIRIETLVALSSRHALDVTQRISDVASGEIVVRGASRHLICTMAH
jgi:acyl-CoA thioesterase FadM